MPFIVSKRVQGVHKVTQDEILFNQITEEAMQANLAIKDTSGTRTCYVKNISPQNIKKCHVSDKIQILEKFVSSHKDLIERDNLEDCYDIFAIAKKTGGVRWITAPNEELKVALSEVKEIFELFMNGNCAHSSAYAYVKGRSTLSAVRKHQLHKSRWFLKTDFSDFFGSINYAWVSKTLGNIFPFSEIVKEERGRIALDKIINLCLLKDGLPQGSPISPLLSNIVMIPIDHYIANKLREKYTLVNDIKYRFCYTRYADDIHISSRVKFDQTEMLDFMKDAIAKFSAPFILKKEKTQFGSNAGKNFIFGVMYTQDGIMSMGHKERDRLKATIHAFVMDYKNNKLWDLKELQSLQGNISYKRQINKTQVDELIQKLNTKYSIDIDELLLMLIKRT